MPGVVLRPYREADLPALYALDQACFPPGIAYSRMELRAFLQHPSAFTAVACDENEIAGFVITRTQRRRRAGRHQPVLHLLTIDVASTARRKGIGKLLMQWVVAKGEELGSCAIVLEVAIDNPGAKSFYEQFGFTTFGTIPGYYNGTIDALQMELALSDVSS